MAADTIINEDFVDDTHDDYILQTVSTDNILHELNLTSDDEAITKSIILNLEFEAASAIKAGLIASLPNVGTIQRDLVKDELKKYKEELRAARARMTKDEYQNYVRDLRTSIKAKVKADYLKRKTVDRIKKQSKKFYDKMLVNRGKHYTNLYIISRLWVAHIPFDREVQDQYDRIAGTYEE